MDIQDTDICGFDQTVPKYNSNDTHTTFPVVLCKSYLTLTDNFYVYQVFWKINKGDGGEIQKLEAPLSQILTLIMISLLGLVILKLLLTITYYSFKVLYYSVNNLIVMIFMRTKKDKYIKKNIWDKTFRRIIYRNFYKHKNNKFLSFIINCIYIAFLVTNLFFLISYFILQFVNFKPEEEPFSIIFDRNILLCVSKSLASYYHLYIDIYLCMYIIIDNYNINADLLLVYYTKSNSSLNLKWFNNLNPISKKMLLALFLWIFIIFVKIICVFFIAFAYQGNYFYKMKESDKDFKFENWFISFYLLRFTNAITEIVLIVLYLLVYVKISGFHKRKYYWRNFFCIKESAIDAIKTDDFSAQNNNNFNNLENHCLLQLDKEIYKSKEDNQTLCWIKFFENNENSMYFYCVRSKLFFKKFLKLAYGILFFSKFWLFIYTGVSTYLFQSNQIITSVPVYLLIRIFSSINSILIGFTSWALFCKIEFNKLWLAD